MSIKQVLNDIDYAACIKQIETYTVNDISRTLSSDFVDFNGFLSLLSPVADSVLEPIAQRSHDITMHQFGQNINLYTPLYISDYCDNVCVYCGFSATQKIGRSQLTQTQIKDELSAIYTMGLRDVLILTGESKKYATPNYIAGAVRQAKDNFKSVGIEVYPMSTDDYIKLIDAGVNSLTLYQETYHQPTYQTLHLKGAKTDYKFRLDTPERAAKAGMHQVSIGALLGLYDPYYEAISMFHHLKYLQLHYPQVELGISFPRIKPIDGKQSGNTHQVTDKLLVKLIMAFRLAFPSISIAISTRESSEFRKHILPLGVTKMSAGVSTAVGGHTFNVNGKTQFNISDDSSVDSVYQLIQSVGYQPILSDWF